MSQEKLKYEGKEVLSKMVRKFTEEVDIREWILDGGRITGE